MGECNCSHLWHVHAYRWSTGSERGRCLVPKCPCSLFDRRVEE